MGWRLAGCEVTSSLSSTRYCEGVRLFSFAAPQHRQALLTTCSFVPSASQVFDGRVPHGDVYARISPCVPGSCAVVPHLVRPPAGSADLGIELRQRLGIPPDATVFGRHGGALTFDVPFAREAVQEMALACPGRIYFLLLNTAEIEGTVGLPNVIYLPPTADARAKSAFILACDAMLHARQRGETFGLAIAEFAVHNKPVCDFLLKPVGAPCLHFCSSPPPWLSCPLPSLPPSSVWSFHRIALSRYSHATFLVPDLIYLIAPHLYLCR